MAENIINQASEPAGEPKLEVHEPVIDGAATHADSPVEPEPLTAGAMPQARGTASSSAVANAEEAGDTEPAEEPDEEGGLEDEDGVEYVEERVVVMRRGIFASMVAVAAVLIIGLAAFSIYQVRKPAPSVATVNGSAISRADYDKAVASANGQQVLDDLVDQRLIDRDAARKKVSVSADDVDTKLKDIKKQFPTDVAYRQALDSQHLTEFELRDRIRRSLLLQKLVGDQGQATDAEVQQAFDQGKDTQYQGKTLDQVKTDIQTQLTQSKQQDAATTYLDNLKKNAKITEHLPGKSGS